MPPRNQAKRRPRKPHHVPPPLAIVTLECGHWLDIRCGTIPTRTRCPRCGTVKAVTVVVL